MKTRELTFDEVNIAISEEDISKIPADNNPALLIDKTASDALITGLNIRGRGTNLFVCGPSAPEREEAVIAAAAAARPGITADIIISEDPDRMLTPSVQILPPGRGVNAVKTGASGGRTARLISAAPAEPEKLPIIIENNPVPARLFGSAGISRTPGTSPIEAVTAGSLAASAGGILLLNAEDLLEEEDSWKLLKRILRTGETVIGAGSEVLEKERFTMPGIKLDLKVVMLGTETHFDHFYNNDEDFRELFQFFAELDAVIELTPETLQASVNRYRNFTADILGKKLTDAAALETIKYSIASAENSEKLSTVTSELELLLTEAAESADLRTSDAGGSDTLDEADLKKAVENQSARFSLLERRILEDIKSGEINLQVDGFEIGKVNGLAVMDKGPWSFGSPGLISARIAPGENGLVNIEHEAGLSGEIHDKWVLILEGFLRSRFGLDFPISIFASICFEQSYSEIDGDSASSSELYALLSAISGVPVRQDIAVTGSLSQTGEIQAVGGLREKIEGFYKACRAINFTGRQGVIVPERNIKNIILPDNIIEDIKNGRFHIYPVSNVDDSMEILTEMEAGSRNTRGMFPHGSLNHLIEKNLRKLASQAKNFGN